VEKWENPQSTEVWGEGLLGEEACMSWKLKNKESAMASTKEKAHGRKRCHCIGERTPRYKSDNKRQHTEGGKGSLVTGMDRSS